MKAITIAVAILLFYTITVSADSITNHYYKLTGYPDGMERTNSPSLSPASNITVEAWVRPDSGTNWHVVCANRIYEYSLPYNSYFLGAHPEDQQKTNRWVFGVATSDSIPSFVNALDTEFIVAHRWTHIAGTYDGTTVRLYVDGNLRSETPCTGAIVYAPHLFKIGFAVPDITQSMQGCIEDVRVWQITRSACEIKRNMYTRLTGAEPGLVAYYPFDNADGTDFTTNANHLAVYGGTFPTDTDVVTNVIYSAIEVAFPSGTPLTSYQLQYSTDLLPTNWINISTPVPGSGDEKSLFDGPRTDPKRFYRVISTY